MSEEYVNALKTLCERESYWLLQRVKKFTGKKFVIFPAGPTAQAFYYTLLNDYGIEAEYFIDNNPELQGKTVCGKLITPPPKKGHGILKNYVILVPTAVEEFYSQIAKQLDDAGVDIYMRSFAFCACQLWDRYEKILNHLYDEESKIAYLGAIYSMLTNDNTFIQYTDNQYFAIKQFVDNGFATVVDAGAYVGDTVEEYIKRGTEGVKVYAFEPYDKAREKLEARVKRLKNEWLLSDDDITVVAAGVGVETKQVNFTKASPVMLKQDEYGDMNLTVYGLDDFFRDKKPFSILKADIEGAELDMLKGAAEAIKKNRPKLVICIYHSE